MDENLNWNSHNNSHPYPYPHPAHPYPYPYRHPHPYPFGVTLTLVLATPDPLLLKTKLTSILPPYMSGVWGSSLKFAFPFTCPQKKPFHIQQ